MSTIATALTWWRRRRQPNFNRREYPVAGRTGEFASERLAH